MSIEIANAVFYAAAFLGVIYGSRILEKRWPIADVPGAEFRADWLAVIVSLGLEHLLAPIAAISAGAIASYAGLGWIKLPTEGYWWYVSLAIVVGIAPCSVELYEAVVAVNDVKRPSQFGQERDCWSPFRSERPARPAGQEVACRL